MRETSPDDGLVSTSAVDRLVSTETFVTSPTVDDDDYEVARCNSLPATVLEALAVVVISLTGVSGNVVVLLARLRPQRSSINIHIINLAIADCLFGLVLPGILPNLILHRYLLRI